MPACVCKHNRHNALWLQKVHACRWILHVSLVCRLLHAMCPCPFTKLSRYICIHVQDHIVSWSSETLLPQARHACRWTLLCQLASWFNAYCLVRTYSNSFETLCTVMGVYYWLSSDTNTFPCSQSCACATQSLQPGPVPHQSMKAAGPLNSASIRTSDLKQTGSNEQPGAVHDSQQAEVDTQGAKQGQMSAQHAQHPHSKGQHAEPASTNTHHAQQQEREVQRVQHTGISVYPQQADTASQRAKQDSMEAQPYHHRKESVETLQSAFSQLTFTPAKTARITTILSPRQKALILAALGVLVRPSSVLFWLPLGNTSQPCIHVQYALVLTLGGINLTMLNK